MPHDIIDNRTRELAPEINNFLADSIRAHFAVGYFFISGFQAIAQHIELRRSWAASQAPTPESPRPVSPLDIYLKTRSGLCAGRYAAGHS